MTIISTAHEPTEFDFPLEEVTPLDKGEGSLDLELRSFPPIDDAVSAIKSIDWVEARRRGRKGLNNVGLVLAVIGEKIHDAGAFLAQV